MKCEVCGHVWDELLIYCEECGSEMPIPHEYRTLHLFNGEIIEIDMGPKRSPFRESKIKRKVVSG